MERLKITREGVKTALRRTFFTTIAVSTAASVGLERANHGVDAWTSFSVGNTHLSVGFALGATEAVGERLDRTGDTFGFSGKNTIGIAFGTENVGDGIDLVSVAENSGETSFAPLSEPVDVFPSPELS